MEKFEGFNKKEKESDDLPKEEKAIEEKGKEKEIILTEDQVLAKEEMIGKFFLYLVALLRAYSLQMIYHTMYGRSHFQIT